MTISTESFISDGNTILKLSNKYSGGTVKGSYFLDSILTNISIIELGEDYIEIAEVAEGVKITIEYNILGTLPEDNQTEFDLKERIVRLEKGMEDMYEIIKAQKEAINNRLNITSFKAWTKLIEKKMGINLIEGDLNHIAKELYKP